MEGLVALWDLSQLVVSSSKEKTSAFPISFPPPPKRKFSPHIAYSMQARTGKEPAVGPLRSRPT